MMEDELEKRTRGWLSRWKVLSVRRRWVLATGGILSICAVAFGLSFITPSPKKDTIAAVVDGDWCESQAAMGVTREIISIKPAIHLCLLREDLGKLHVPPSALVGEAVTHYPAPVSFPPDGRALWGLCMLVLSVVVGYLVASDRSPPKK